MNKKEFLNTLREQLQGTMSQSEMEGHIRYYDDYISGEISAGKSQQQIMEELGNPVFIAKTLIETARTSAQSGSAYENDNTGSYEQREEDYSGGKIHTFHINDRIARWLIPLVLILAFVLVISLLGSVAVLAARYFLPIILVLIVIAIFKSKKG